MNITRFHVGIWRQDLKIIGAALSRYIRCKFSGMISRIRNIENPFPLHRNYQKNLSSPPVRQSMHIYYGEGAHDTNVVLLSYTKFPLS